MKISTKWSKKTIQANHYIIAKWPPTHILAIQVFTVFQLFYFPAQSAVAFHSFSICRDVEHKQDIIKYIHKIKSKIPFSKNFLVHSLNKLKLTTKSPYITYTSRAQHSAETEKKMQAHITLKLSPTLYS